MPDTTYQPGDLLIFQHIAKTAGSTLRWSLVSKFPLRSVLRCYHALGCSIERDINQRPDSWKRRIRFFATSIEFGSHIYFPQPATYLTMLREPDVRMLSHYYFHQWLGISVEDFDTFLDRLNGQNFMDNLQVRALSGTRKVGRVGQPELERARHHLETHFSAFGLVEKFKTSLTLFATIYGWPTVPLISRNINKNRPSLDALTDEQRARLHDHNTLDHQLYAYAQQRFDKLVADHAITPDLIERTIRQDRTARIQLILNRLIHNIFRRLTRLT